MSKSKLIAEQIKKIRPLIKEANPQQKLKLMKLMKVALKEGFDERQALIHKLASNGKYDVSDLELATDEELQQLLSDDGQSDVAENWEPLNPEAVRKQKEWQQSSASDSTYEVKTFAYQGYTIKFKPDVVEVYLGSELVYSRPGDFSNPTKSQLVGIRNVVGKLVDKKNRDISESKDYLEEK